MKPGDLVRVYTIANTHVERGAYGIITRKSTHNDEWWIVYVMSEDKLFTFHTEQLRPIESKEKPTKIDIHKSYWLFDKD